MSKILDWINKNEDIKKKDAVVYRKNKEYLAISYEQLYNYINSLSFFLKDYKNKTIAIIGNNKLEYVISLLSIICNIGDVFLVDKESKQNDIENMFNTIKPDLVILDDELDFCFNIKTITFEIINIEMKKQNKFEIDKTFSGNLILHTSGSTGKPKYVKLSEEKYTYIIKDLNVSWRVNDTHSCLFIIPLYHVYALISLFHGLYAGVTNILEYDSKRLTDVLKKTSPSIFLGVPFVFNKIKDNIYEKAGNKLNFAILFSNLLLMFNVDIRKRLFKDIHSYFGNNYYFSVSGGAQADPKTNKFFNDIGLPVYNGYGLTETCGPVAICYENNNIYESVGKILNNDVIIINKNCNGIGEICIKGKNIFDGYIGENNDNIFIDGYFKTGDLGYVKNNFLYITGRNKKLLIRDNGKNISENELIDKILENDKIIDCNITMQDNKIIAIISSSLSYEEANQFIDSLNDRLPKYKQISEIKIVNKGF